MFEYEQGQCPAESEYNNVDNSINDNETVDNGGEVDELVDNGEDNTGQVDGESTNISTQENTTGSEDDLETGDVDTD